MMSETDIEAEYLRLKPKLYPDGREGGWCFAMNPVSWLERAKMVIVSLNPGGIHEELSCNDRACFEVPDRSTYFHNDWPLTARGSHLAKQVRALYGLAGFKEHEGFAAQFVPFRTGGASAIPPEAFKFGAELWTEALKSTESKLFICFGEIVFSNIWGIIQNLENKQSGNVEYRRAEWGNVRIRRWVSARGKVVVGIPHPSRYLLLDAGDDANVRETRREAVRWAIRPA